MRDLRILAALAPLVLVISAPVLADDPNDPTMSSRTARERDRAMIRKLNRDQLAYVRERDARYAEGWADYRQAHGHRRVADEDESGYRDARSEYEAAMAQWREDVAACRAGYYDHCAR